MNSPTNAEIELKESIKRTNAYACLDCGKCTSVCPVSIFGDGYSPRKFLRQTLLTDYESHLSNYDLWSCLTCKQCDDYCLSAIDYVEMTQILRTNAIESGSNGKCSHAGALQSLQHLMTTKKLRQNRLEWVTDEMKTSRKGKILFFVGCSPYFDIFFSELGVNTLDSARNSVRILNKLNIKPVLLANERCCGHDLLWNGDLENFKSLAAQNVREIKKSGADTILFSCAECMSAFNDLYPKHGFGLDAELKHMSQFIAESISEGFMELAESERKVTFKDPCRLGRHLGIYDEPRQILNADDNGHYAEMKQNRKDALCCGVSGWMNCDATSKTIQVNLLEQANEILAEEMAVACPKCQIHLTCAMKGNGENSIEIKDLSTIVLERMDV